MFRFMKTCPRISFVKESMTPIACMKYYSSHEFGVRPSDVKTEKLCIRIYMNEENTCPIIELHGLFYLVDTLSCLDSSIRSLLNLIGIDADVVDLHEMMERPLYHIREVELHLQTEMSIPRLSGFSLPELEDNFQEMISVYGLEMTPTDKWGHGCNLMNYLKQRHLIINIHFPPPMVFTEKQVIAEFLEGASVITLGFKTTNHDTHCRILLLKRMFERYSLAWNIVAFIHYRLWCNVNYPLDYLDDTNRYKKMGDFIEEHKDIYCKK
jgi:hypothetical protein